MKRAIVFGVWLALLSARMAAAQTTITVGPGGGYDYPGIQAAIDAATTGDTVAVYPAIYITNIHLGGKNIIVRGSKPTDPATVAATVIDGNRAGSAVTFAGTETGDCVLSGLTIRNGEVYFGPGGGIRGNGTHARIEYNIITGNGTRFGDGAGVYRCDGAIHKNTIMCNSGDRGAALFQCNGTIRDNTIMFNLAWFRGPLGGGAGLFDCDGTVENNTITDNLAFHHGAGLHSCDGLIENNTIARNSAWRGGGLCYCAGTIRNNRIEDNQATTLGGGVTDCHGTIENNIIAGNTAGESVGGVLECYGVIRNNLIVGNSAALNCGGVYAAHGTLENNTIVGNSAGSYGGGALLCWGSITNCIIWGNTDSTGNDQVYESTMPTYSCVDGWTSGGLGNTSANPLFVDPDGPDNDPSTYEDNDYHLAAGSPCIDAGNPAAEFNDRVLPPGLGTERNDTGAYGGPHNHNWLTQASARVPAWVLYR